MSYPTLQQVEAANRLQLGQWSRFLKSPGHSAIGQMRAEFESVMRKEKRILDRIIERFTALGGFSPAISKTIGWR